MGTNLPQTFPSDDYFVHLAKRLVACKSFRWATGMALRSGERVVMHSQEGVWWVSSGVSSFRLDLSKDGILPDLWDAATGGCIIGLCRRKVHPDLHSVPEKSDGTWDVCKGAEGVGQGYTEVEAWVAVLEGYDG